jgi:predicted dehydrogenase
MTLTSRSSAAQPVSRRSFLEGSVALAAAAALPGGAFAAGSDRIRIGLVGCGGRGVGAAAQAVAADEGVVIAALGDRFADQLAAATATLSATCGSRFAPAGLFHGPEAAELVIAADLDAVILATPPGFRPAEIARAVEAGRHIYAEAPLGVDATGVRAATAAVEAGQRRGLSLASGLQSRHLPAVCATVAAVAAGCVGQPRRGVVIHHLGLPWMRPVQPGWSAEEARLRSWINDDQLSGGGFLHHLVHALDRCSWALGEPTPLVATTVLPPAPLPSPPTRGTAATARIAFADGTTLEAGIVRRAGIEDRIAEVIEGSLGHADLRRGTVAGAAVPAVGAVQGGGHAACMASFIASLRGGPARADLATAARSTMLAVMARTAVATGVPVAWGDLWQASPAPRSARPVQSSRV